MSNKEAKKVIVLNVVLWGIAMLLHPLSQLIHSGSGGPPKFYSLLIPMAFIGLAGISTWLLKTALGAGKSE